MLPFCSGCTSKTRWTTYSDYIHISVADQSVAGQSQTHWRHRESNTKLTTRHYKEVDVFLKHLMNPTSCLTRYWPRSCWSPFPGRRKMSWAAGNVQRCREMIGKTRNETRTIRWFRTMRTWVNMRQIMIEITAYNEHRRWMLVDSVIDTR